MCHLTISQLLGFNGLVGFKWSLLLLTPDSCDVPSVLLDRGEWHWCHCSSWSDASQTRTSRSTTTIIMSNSSDANDSSSKGTTEAPATEPSAPHFDHLDQIENDVLVTFGFHQPEFKIHASSPFSREQHQVFRAHLPTYLALIREPKNMHSHLQDTLVPMIENHEHFKGKRNPKKSDKQWKEVSITVYFR